ncbi:DUF58 domain-containing protein [Trichlorobacter ammonificans]|uniref:DUF58 domain-containing protein n=1 Tax=Trichlorobacter ammonificans TaxID=2916410 RepID=A0ABN8HIE6_9BACT|nr:DUF58 domain-containing protein [Trichlorobacter ammonificans]CAH2030923.1 DUF58 domain-containing protein [Trichlorobacter ammonificans]
MGFAAVNTGNNLLFLVVSGMLAFMSVTGIIGMANLKGLGVALAPPDEVHAGRPALFSLQLTNSKKWLPSFLLQLSSGAASVQCTALAPASGCVLPLTLQFEQRGVASIRHLRVSSPFPVNFFVRSWTLPVQCDLVVFPRQTPCWNVASGNDGQKHAPAGSVQRGWGGEVERIREYTGRDPLQSIHWKLSAREDEVKVKEYAESSAESLLINPSLLPGDGEDRIAGAAWLAVQWGSRRPVGLLLAGELVPPQQGRGQIRKILARLAVYGIEDESVSGVQGP